MNSAMVTAGHQEQLIPFSLIGLKSTLNIRKNQTKGDENLTEKNTNVFKSEKCKIISQLP